MSKTAELRTVCRSCRAGCGVIAVSPLTAAPDPGGLARATEPLDVLGADASIGLAE